MQKTVILLTGMPGTGKTTLIMQVTEALKAHGINIGGMVTKEQREGGARVGFIVQDVSTGKQGWLAHVNQPNGPRVGKYRVNMGDLEDIGAKAIRDAIIAGDAIVIDEIGPMELHSQVFRQAVQDAIMSGKAVIATIHYKATDALVKAIKMRPDVELVEVTFQNRANLHNIIIEKITRILRGS
jgi:nucleoside-triphosphatase